MFTLHPTQDLAKALKLGVLPLSPPQSLPLTNWCVRGFHVGRATYLIFTETMSLYSLIAPRRGTTTGSKLRRTFATTVHEKFNHPTLGDAPAANILKSMSDCQFSLYRDRHVLGSINDLVWNAQGYIESGLSMFETIHRVNEAPMGHLKMDSPTKMLAQLLATPEST